MQGFKLGPFATDLRARQKAERPATRNRARQEVSESGLFRLSGIKTSCCKFKSLISNNAVCNQYWKQMLGILLPPYKQRC
jgi:hypothetical protein